MSQTRFKLYAYSIVSDSMLEMEDLYCKLQERRKRETTPLIPIFEAYDALLQLSSDLQRRVNDSDKEISELLRRVNCGKREDGSSSNNNTKSLSLALRNETRLREKLEKLQTEYNAKAKAERDLVEELKTAVDSNASMEVTIRELTESVQGLTSRSTKLEESLQESELNKSLAEQQNDGLKLNIRALQDENQALKEENGLFGDRLVTDKEKMVNELNQLNDVVEKLSKENEALRVMQRKNEQDRKAALTKPAWFGVFSSATSSTDKNETSISISSVPESKAQNRHTLHKHNQDILPVSCPTVTHQTIAQAHSTEGTCLRFDRYNNDIFATSSIGGSVKTWNAKTGKVTAIFYGTPGHSMLTCDVSQSLVAGAGNDKTCRIWDTASNRMIHRLAGHQHKVTCVRILNNNQSVLTCSADRSMKIWDVSKQTYRLSSTLSFNSFAASMDVVSDSKSAVSGHSDGSLLFWDLETAQMTTEIKGIHEGGVASVYIDPVEPTRVLTSTLASSLHVVDVRSGKSVRTFHNETFSTRHSHGICMISPDGQFVAAGSDSGEVFVWDLATGVLHRKLSDDTGSNAALAGIDWRVRTEKNEPQIAAINRKGAVILLR